jgi:hypothetical protein
MLPRPMIQRPAFGPRPPVPAARWVRRATTCAARSYVRLDGPGGDVTHVSGSSGSLIRICVDDAERRELDKKLLCLNRGAARYAEHMSGDVVGTVGQLMRRIAIATRVCACLCLFLDAASDAMAAQAKVEGVSIALPVPAGFCELSSGNPTDQRILETIGEALAKARGNQLLAMSADCRQLADWRDGRRLLGDYGQYQAPRIAAANDETFRQTCAALRSQGGRSFANTKNETKAKMEDSIRQMKVNDQRFAGFLGEDPTACYIALLQKLKAEEGPDVTQVTVLAITMVKGKFLFVNRYAPYLNADSIAETLAKLKLTITALQEANRG